MALRPEGFDGPLVLEGDARDLWTGLDGAGSVMAEAAYRGTVDNTRRVRSITTRPAVNADRLVGAQTSSGFRTMLKQAAPDERAERSPLYLLLDDVPVVTLVADYAALRAGQPPPGPRTLMGTIGVCAGYRRGGTIAASIAADGSLPVVLGPPAPSLLSDDPLGWHSLPPLDPHSMRRARRLDLARTGDVLEFDVHLRDSHMAPEGTETVIHEYAVRGIVDFLTLTIQEVRADPRVLPWVECPAAAASPGRLAGWSVAALRDQVHRELSGTTTCTHLNDTLRSLEDIAALAPALRRRTAPAATSQRWTASLGEDRR